MVNAILALLISVVLSSCKASPTNADKLARLRGTGASSASATTSDLTAAATASAALSTVSATPGSTLADGTAAVTVTVTLKDANSTALAAKTVTLASSRGATDTVATVSGTTNASGQATFTVKSSTMGSPTLTAADTTDSVTVTQTASPFFIKSAGLKIWLKADAIQALSDGNDLTTWLDSSGNGIDATYVQRIGTLIKPKYKTNILNGNPAVRFGSACCSSSLSTSAVTIQDRSVFIVVSPLGNPPADDQGGAHMLIIQNSSPWYEINAWTGGSIHLYDGSYYDTGVSFSGTKLVSQVTGGSGSNIYVNGNLATSSASAAASINAIMLIGEWDSSGSIYGGLNGDIAEIIVFNSTLSNAERQAVETYLNSKYAVY